MSFKAQELIDSFTNVDAGVNEGVSPDILPKNQLARALNITVRGTFANPRPYFKKMTLDYGGNAALQAMVEKPLWQKGCYYKPDFGLECLTAAIAGRLFKFEVSGDTLTVSDITGASPQVATQTQAWLWQSENFLIFNDGVSNPLFYDGTNTTRSNSGLPVKLPIAFQNTAPFTIPAVGATSAGVAVDNTTNVNVGDTVTLKNKGQFVVQAVVAGVSVDLLNISAGPVGQILQPPAPLTPNFTGFDLGTGDELPPGRMGVYGMGRNWVCLVDGKQFVASDCPDGDCRWCVNPAHLWIGDAKHNSDDKILKQRYRAAVGCGERNGHHKLSLEQVESIRNNYVRRYGAIRDLAIQHGVAWQTIWNILHHKGWKYGNSILPVVIRIPESRNNS